MGPDDRLFYCTYTRVYVAGLRVLYQVIYGTRADSICGRLPNLIPCPSRKPATAKTLAPTARPTLYASTAWLQTLCFDQAAVIPGGQVVSNHPAKWANGSLCRRRTVADRTGSNCVVSDRRTGPSKPPAGRLPPRSNSTCTTCTWTRGRWDPQRTIFADPSAVGTDCRASCLLLAYQIGD